MWSLPSWIGLAAIGAAVAFGGVQSVRLAHEQTARTKDQVAWAKVRTEAAETATTQSERIRELERMQSSREREAINAANNELRTALSDASAALSAAERLRQRTATIARRCDPPGPATATASGATSPNPGDLLADMLSRTVEDAGRLAEYADQAVIDARSCEAAWPR